MGNLFQPMSTTNRIATNANSAAHNNIKEKIMKSFYVFNHPNYKPRIERDGFTVLGFLFPVIWLIAKGLYRQAAIVAIVMFACVFVMNEETQKIEQTTEERLSQYESSQMGGPSSAHDWLMQNDPEYAHEHRLSTEYYIDHRNTGSRQRLILIILLILGVQLITGFYGRKWVLDSLRKRGFIQDEMIKAHTKDAVLAALANKSDTGKGA